MHLKSASQNSREIYVIQVFFRQSHKVGCVLGKICKRRSSILRDIHVIRSSVFTQNGYRELGDREKRVTYSDKACQRNLVLKRNPCDMSFFGG